MVYSYGKDFEDRNLPFISPLRYFSALDFRKGKFTTEIAVQGNATQTQYSHFYGEDRTPDFAILNFNAGYFFTFEKVKCNTKAGIENIFETYYSTFSDWNNIPRQGRNIFLNVNFRY